ncbi:hypothetical protein CWC08_18970, partial [Pseudoalteromonas ruthenica]|uniref:hypothetical protein n=1 Tax=Pseudoalteromonas ruthenica TaxID=151081 RepID=UPI001275E68E
TTTLRHHSALQRAHSTGLRTIAPWSTILLREKLWGKQTRTFPVNLNGVQFNNAQGEPFVWLLIEDLRE